MRTIPGTELQIKDRYGDHQTIRKTQNGYQVVRERLTPVLALNKETGKRIGERIKTLRLARGWTLAELCTRADIRTTTPKQRMWEIENGVREGLTFGTVYAMAIALGVEITDLVPTVAEMRDIAAPETVKQTRLTVKDGAA